MRCALVLALASAAACGGATPTPPPTIADDPGYPAGPYGYTKGEILADLQFSAKIVDPGARASSAAWQTLSLGTMRAANIRFFVIETAGAWCSDCIADQPAMMQLEADYAPRGVRGMELLVEGALDQAASGDDLDGWSSDHGTSGTLLLDANRTFERAAGLIAFPTYFIVDAATMRIAVRSVDTLAGTPLGPALDALLSH